MNRRGFFSKIAGMIGAAFGLPFLLDHSAITYYIVYDRWHRENFG